MIKLGIEREPKWLNLPLGVKVKVLPLTPAIYQTAMARMRQEITELVAHQKAVEEAGGRVEDLPALTDKSSLEAVGHIIFTNHLACLAITEWEGVIDQDDEPAMVTEAYVREVMSDGILADEFFNKYTRKYEQLRQEGNASALSPNGTGAGAPDTAAAAEPKTSLAQTAGQA